MKKTFISMATLVLASLFSLSAMAKLPAPSDEAKAKAAEAAKRLGQEAARAAGELELGAGDGVGANPHIPRL